MECVSAACHRNKYQIWESSGREAEPLGALQGSAGLLPAALPEFAFGP